MGLQCQVYVESSLEHHPLGLVKQQHPREYGGAVGVVVGNGLCLSLLGVHGGGPCHHHDGGANGTGNGVPCVNQVAEVAVDRQIPRATVVSTVGV